MPYRRSTTAHGHVGDTIGPFGPYLTRVMLGIVAALTLLVVLTRLPLYEGPTYVDWRYSLRTEPYQLQEVTREMIAQTAREAPITRFTEEEEVVPEEEGADEETTEVIEPAEVPMRTTDRPQRRMDILDVSEQMPQVAGGLGAFYIHIEYPPAAARAGIEGKLVLAFVVEPDGRPSEIEVLEPLHPLCDSAAVRALRATYFVPGRQNGETVRVRMRLPVRFQLYNSGEAPGSPES